MADYSKIYYDLIKARVTSLPRLERVKLPQGVETGVTPGGYHKDAEDGAQWYVKHHTNPEHAYVEHLANQTYRALGHTAPHSLVLEHPDSKPVYVSKIIPGFKTLSGHLKAWHLRESAWDGSGARDNVWTPHETHIVRKFKQGLAADTLVGNTDLHTHNVGVIYRHAVARIDNGAAFHMTPWGVERNSYGWPTLHTIADDSTHKDAERRLEYKGNDRVSPHLLRPQVKAITDLRDQHGGWHGFVEHHIPGASPETKRKAAEFMEHQTNKLVGHLNGEPFRHSHE